MAEAPTLLALSASDALRAMSLVARAEEDADFYAALR
jgi:hypothetical protein